MQSPALEASTPPIATTGIEIARQISPSPSEADRRVGVGFRGRRPDRTSADVGGALPLPVEGFGDGGGGRAEQQARRDGALGAVVLAAEVDAVGPEPKRRLDVVVHDEERVQPGEALPRLDQLVRARALAPQLHDGRAALDRRAPRREVLDDRVQPHESLARESSFFGSRS